MKFDFTVMNPPYMGKGDPLFMQIAKVFYDTCRNPGGHIVSINPTSVSDNTYPTVSSKLKNKYGKMKVLEYEYSPDLRDAFDDADIGTGICITVYSDNGTHTLFDDYVHEKRFGKDNWDMRKTIIEEKVSSKLGVGNLLNGEIPSLSVAALPGFKKWSKDAKEPKEDSSDSVKKKWDDYIKKFNVHKTSFSGKNIVLMAYNRGHVNKWDWNTLQSDEYLKVQSELPNISQFDVPFDDKRKAVEFIKWINTDFIMYIVSHYKTQMTNNMIMFKLLPQPPAFDSNYSDEVLMKYFGLTQNEMDWIHSEMKDFGWKVNLGKTESELMAYIDEINK